MKGCAEPRGARDAKALRLRQLQTGEHHGVPLPDSQRAAGNRHHISKANWQRVPWSCAVLCHVVRYVRT